MKREFNNLAGLPPAEQAAALGVTRRQFDYWCSHGLIYSTPGEASPGTGATRRPLTRRELEVLAVMARLVKGGLAPAPAARVARELCDTGTSSLAGHKIIRGGGG